MMLLVGCQQELGRPPVPRFTLDPEWIEQGDDFRTPVVLDATASADELDDPRAPLDVTWSFDDERVRFADGDDEHGATVTVTAAGERPLTIVLTVTDPDGLASSLSHRLGITVPER